MCWYQHVLIVAAETDEYHEASSWLIPVAHSIDISFRFACIRENVGSTIPPSYT